MSTEASHYVVTSHPPGGVLMTTTCNFMGTNTTDVIVAKSRRLEVRQATGDDPSSSSPFPVVLTLPIHGRITSLLPLRNGIGKRDYLFLTTDRFRYAVLAHDESSTPHACKTLASGNLKLLSTAEAAAGPLVSIDPNNGSCIALHLYDGLLTILPIHHHPGFSPSSSSSLLGEPYQVRLEERAVLDVEFLYTASTQEPPLVAILHQDARSAQHVVCYQVDLKRKILTQVWKKRNVDGGSSRLLAIPPVMRNAAASSSNMTNNNNATAPVVIVLGQRQITSLTSRGMPKVVPLPFCLLTSATYVPHGKFLLGDEFGNIHVLTLETNGRMALDTLLGVCHIPNSLAFIPQRHLLFVGSQFGDSQLLLLDGIKLELVEEYTNLGPIVDFDLVETHTKNQHLIVTCSGSSTSGSLRIVKNGIGMNEVASVEMEGIQHMWSIRKSYSDTQDAYLAQSFVGQTRVLGVTSDTAGDTTMDDDDDEAEDDGTLEELVLSGLESNASSLYVGNVQVHDTILQITETELRLLSASTMSLTTTWSPDTAAAATGEKIITVASANEAGQIVISLKGGKLVYLQVKDSLTIEVAGQKNLEHEVSCVDLNPFATSVATLASAPMEVDDARVTAPTSNVVAVGLWDDFSVRFLSLDASLHEVLHINLSTNDEEETETAERATRRTRNNMMARSLCLLTLDSPSTSSSSGSANMLFVGLGDGTLISFAVLERDGGISVSSRKEVSLGTQRINLVPLQTDQGGTCLLATGDRPTVIYLAGGGSSGNFANPKLCYSNVNLSTSDTGEEDDVNRPPAQQSIAVNVATPFVSPQLFDVSSVGNKHFSLCVSDDSNLRLGVIDDIQKLHVTTYPLGMAPRRVVHCSEDRMFAVGCIESGLQPGGSTRDDVNMGNCIRFLDDTTFDEIERIDLEPFEMILSLLYANLGASIPTFADDALIGEDTPMGVAKPYLLIGTGYALPDEDEPTRGRIIVLSCSSQGGTEGKARGVRHVTELQVTGGVYAMCQFYNNKVLATVNSKTQVCQLSDDGTGVLKLHFVGIGHHGHILSQCVKSKATRDSSSASSKSPREDDPMMDESPTKKKPAIEDEKEQLAIVGDLMRSISLVQYYPEHKALEEVARDFNANWITAIEMLTDNIYLGAENWNHLFVVRRNNKANSEEVRCRLDTVGEFHLGEMVNKFMCGSLVMPHSTSSNASRRKVALRMTSPVKTKAGSDKPSATTSRAFRPTVTIGTQTLFATVDGTVGSILGLDARTAAFFKTLERAMAKTITPVGDLGHAEFRAFDCEGRNHASHGFVDGDLVESFLDLDRPSMEAVVKELNRDGGWDVDNFTVRSHQQLVEEVDDATDEAMTNELELAVEDVIAMVEEMTMFH